nr:hypothetical protein [Tanacetum cinerariifolium]
METPALTTLVSCDGLGEYDWSNQAKEGPNYALMAFNLQVLTQRFPPPYTGLDMFVDKPIDENTKSCEEETKAVRKNSDALIIEEWVSNDEDENVTQPNIVKKIVRPNIVKKDFVKPRQQETHAKKTIKKVKHNRQNTNRPKGNQRN